MPYYVHLTINEGQREYDLTMPVVKSLDDIVQFMYEQYPNATSMVLSVVFDNAKVETKA
jgi:hypothetical protein